MSAITTKIPVPAPERARLNITLPEWLRDEAALYGAKRGYGLSELIARTLEKFVEQEKARIAAEAQVRSPLAETRSEIATAMHKKTARRT